MTSQQLEPGIQVGVVGSDMHVSVWTRAGNGPSRSLKFFNNRECLPPRAFSWLKAATTAIIRQGPLCPSRGLVGDCEP